MPFPSVLLVLLNSLAGGGAGGGPCEPSPGIRAELQLAAAPGLTDPLDFDRNIVPFLELRKLHPDDLFVHERYQDAVEAWGIEGHLRKLTEDYRDLAARHSGSLPYAYLYARTLIGRSTPAAIQAMAEIITKDPAFAPAHRALAETFASLAFHDEERSRAERERFLALCPSSVLARRPRALPDPSPLVQRAQRLFAEGGDPDRASRMALEGIRADEWRLQRIRPFDWYGVDYKRLNQEELRAEYWRLWSLQVRCHRRAGRLREAKDLLALMDQRAAQLRPKRDPVYWEAQTTLARLYAEGAQEERANEKLDLLRRMLAEHPDPGRDACLEDLCKLLGHRSP